MDNRDIIESALNTLAEASNSSYRPEYVENISKWEKAGLSLAKITDRASGIFEMVYSFLEDWNYHTENFLLSYVFPQYLNKGEDLRYDKTPYWKSDIVTNKKLEKLLSREIVIQDFVGGEVKIVGKAIVKVSVEYIECEVE